MVAQRRPIQGLPDTQVIMPLPQQDQRQAVGSASAGQQEMQVVVRTVAADGVEAGATEVGQQDSEPRVVRGWNALEEEGGQGAGHGLAVPVAK